MQSARAESGQGGGIEEDENAKSAEDAASTSETSAEDFEKPVAAPWRGLFFFTTKANIPVLVAGILASLVSGAVSPAQSFVTGRFLDRLITYAAGTLQKDEFMDSERKYVCYLLIVGGVSWISAYAELAFWIAFGELQAKSARDRLFHGLLLKEIEWYDLRKHGIGALLPRLEAQIRALQLATSQPLGILAGTASQALLSLIQALVLSWKLTLVTLASAPVVMFAVIWVGRGIQHAFRKQDEILTEAQKYATSALSNIETVKCFNAQAVEQRKYITSVTAAATFYFRATNANAIQMGFITLLSVSMLVQGFYYGGILIAKGEVSVANVITTFMSAINAFSAINAILPQLIVLEKGRNAGSVLRTVMAEMQQGSMNHRSPDSLAPSQCHGAIEVRNLTFSYPARPEHDVLTDVSISIPKGEVTFLIGRSGSGKSTLGQLLLRFYTASHGTIQLDGVHLGSLDTSWLRQNVTLVEQTSSLFNDTIFRNVALGRTTPDDTTYAEFASAVQFALLQSMITDLPDGAETLVGYKGSTLSGGQRQRMALARARLRDTAVLVLDESTSALDRISRALMMDAIRLWRRGKTTIIVTHDISQILPNDYLYILEHGRVVQEGFRENLEKLKASPFQGFLPEDTTTTTSNRHARQTSSVYSVETRDVSLGVQSEYWSSIPADPLEAHLYANEYKPAARSPSIFTDGSPLPGLQARASIVTSPWTSLAPTSPADFRSTALWSAPWSRQQSVADHDVHRRRTQTSDQLANHIQRTAKLAADSRMTPGGESRRRANATNVQSRKSSLTKGSKHSEVAVTNEQDKFSGRVQTLRQIMSTLWPSIDWLTRAVLLLGVWGATVHAVCTPILSFMLSKLLKLYSIPGGDTHASLLFSMIILGISAVDAVHTYAFRFFLEFAGQRWIDSVRGEAMERILNQPRAFFDEEENAVSRLTGSLDRNAEEMRNLLGRFAAMVWIAICLCGVSFVWATITQWKMALIALSTGPYLLGVAKAFGMISEKWEKLSNDATEDAAAIFTETFTNIRTVRALTLERHFIDKYVKATKRAVSIGFRRAFFTGFFYGLSDSAGNFSIAMIYYVGASLVVHGVPVGSIIQVFVFLGFAISNLNAILQYIPQITTSKDMASRLLRLAQLPQTSHEDVGEARIMGVGDVVFDDLQFSYPSRQERSVLKHFSMHIRPGTCTAIVGGSGSGKSTIASLLLKLYSTTSRPELGLDRANDLTFAGRNIQRIDTTTVRNLIVPVSQTPTLFPATVSENIAYGLPSTSSYNDSSAISDAAMQAGVHDFILSLPQGYDTLISEGGIGISGGQAQRIAIARALVRRPSVLILDEATSALDVESANLVRQTIENLVAGRGAERSLTVIIISHSREMMEIAEKVVVLENGRIVEEGGFAELMGRRGGALVNLLSGGEWTGDQEDI